MDLFSLLLFSTKLMSFINCEEISTSNYISTKQDMAYQTGNKLEEIRDSDQVSCALRCSRRNDCQGANFQISTRNCDLESFGSSRKLQKAPGVVFMELLKLDRSSKQFPTNCAELCKAGQVTSGVYTVDPDGLGPFDVYCDQGTNGGGWTVFQRRWDGSVNFFRDWRTYKRGFGKLTGEFWLGLDKLYRLTGQNNSQLRIELEDFNQSSAYAEYEFFSVSDETDKYRLSVGNYSAGTAGDSFKRHSRQQFSTKDQDNDRNSTVNCARRCKGGWWYGSCIQSNLNGLYYHGHHPTPEEGINWRRWRGYHYSAKRAEMKIRPVDFSPS